MIREIKGDLFESPSDFCLVHCVSSDLKMGAGIALEFGQRFGRVEELKSQNPQVGSFVFISDKERQLFYLVTKAFYYQKPTYSSLTLALIELCNFCLDHSIRKLALPKIGCGLDKLEWSRVLLILQEIFAETGIELRIYSL